jgi:hypothetical protein
MTFALRCNGLTEVSTTPHTQLVPRTQLTAVRPTAPAPTPQSNLANQGSWTLIMTEGWSSTDDASNYHPTEGGSRVSLRSCWVDSIKRAHGAKVRTASEGVENVMGSRPEASVRPLKHPVNSEMMDDRRTCRCFPQNPLSSPGEGARPPEARVSYDPRAKLEGRLIKLMHQPVIGPRKQST